MMNTITHLEKFKLYKQWELFDTRITNTHLTIGNLLEFIEMHQKAEYFDIAFVDASGFDTAISPSRLLISDKCVLFLYDSFHCNHYRGNQNNPKILLLKSLKKYLGDFKQVLKPRVADVKKLSNYKDLPIFLAYQMSTNAFGKCFISPVTRLSQPIYSSMDEESPVHLHDKSVELCLYL